MKYGTSHPGKIDIIGVKGDKVVVSLIQADEVDENNIFALQEKLNNYLAFILDGQLDEEFPQYRGKSAIIEVTFKFEPKGVAKDFIEKATQLCLNEGVKLVCKIGV